MAHTAVRQSAVAAAPIIGATVATAVGAWQWTQIGDVVVGEDAEHARTARAAAVSIRSITA